MFVSYLVRSQFIVPYRLLRGVPVRRQSVNSAEIACSFYIENDLVTFSDLRPGLVAIRRPHVLLCQNRPVAFDDGPNPVGGHVPRRGILLAGQKRCFVRSLGHPPVEDDRPQDQVNNGPSEERGPAA